jgi:subtilisin family serine protease
MLHSAFFSRVRAYAALLLVGALLACGGSESSGDAASNPATGSSQARASQSDPLALDRSPANSAAAKSADLIKNGNLPGSPTSKDYHPTRILVKLIETPQTTSAQAKASAFGAMGLRQMTGFTGTQSLSKQSSAKTSPNGMAIFEITNPTLTVPQAVEQLQRSGLVVYAEPDYFLKKQLAPNDPSYGIYWHLKNTGQSFGVIGNDINAEVAWNTTTGTGQVVVAVIDDGVKYDHPDLAANMWSSAGTPRVVVPGDTSGSAGITDDANGANLAISRGIGETSVLPYNLDGSDHGTMVSGFIGAAGNNTIGGSGVSWNVTVMALKIEGPDLSTSTSSFVNAIRYAIAKKAAGVNLRVINISYGGYFSSQAYKDALEEANTAGILVVIAAGNDGSNDERNVGFPSGYKTPNLISVGALTRNNTRATFSNYGSLVHLFAPGANVPTTSSRASPPSGYIAPYYRYTDGTSFASPIVAGAAALLWMQYPSETALQIKARLLNSTTPFLSTAESMAGGKLNLGAAITNPVPCVASAPVITELASQLVQGATHKVSAYMKTCATTGVVAVNVNGVTTQIKDDGVYPDEYANDGYYSGTFVAPASAATSIGVSVTVQDSALGNLSSGLLNRLLKPAISYASASITYSWDAPTNLASYSGLVGDPVSKYDDGALPVTSPFPVNFDGRSISSFYMSTNGYLCMDDVSCLLGNAYPLPTGKNGKALGVTQALIAPWWNDWTVDCTSSNMHSQTFGTAPNRRFVLTWQNVLPYYSGLNCSLVTNGVSFQVVFYEGQNYIDFRYQDVITYSGPVAPNPSYGVIGSGGIQLTGGKLGTQLFYNTSNVIAASNAFRFTPRYPSFTDVPIGQFFTTSIEGLRGSRITLGCVAGVSFCPNDKTTQEQMAAFIARAILGHNDLANYTIYPASGYTDVNTTYVPYVNFLKFKGIMTGTGTVPGKFCVTNALICGGDFVTRAQMARYLVKAARGGNFVPPPATGALFTDVPANHPEGAYIEELIRMKITNGTGTGTTYSPDQLVSRSEMATFLQRTFRPFDPH